MYYLLEDIKLLETYKDSFVGNIESVRYSLDKTKYIVESTMEIDELKKFKKTKGEALILANSLEFTKSDKED